MWARAHHKRSAPSGADHARTRQEPVCGDDVVGCGRDVEETGGREKRAPGFKRTPEPRIACHSLSKYRTVAQTVARPSWHAMNSRTTACGAEQGSIERRAVTNHNLWEHLVAADIRSETKIHFWRLEDAVRSAEAHVSEADQLQRCTVAATLACSLAQTTPVESKNSNWRAAGRLSAGGRTRCVEGNSWVHATPSLSLPAPTVFLS